MSNRTTLLATFSVIILLAVVSLVTTLYSGNWLLSLSFATGYGEMVPTAWSYAPADYAPDSPSFRRMTNALYHSILHGEDENEKFLLYDVGGGLNHQKFLLECAIHTAARYNRTLLVTPFIRHLKLLSHGRYAPNYRNVTQDDLIRADVLINLAHIPNKRILLEPIGATVTGLANAGSSLEKEWHFETAPHRADPRPHYRKTYVNLESPEFNEALRTKKFVLLQNPIMWILGNVLSDNHTSHDDSGKIAVPLARTIAKPFPSLSWSSELIRLGNAARLALFRGRRHYCIHMRRGDYLNALKVPSFPHREFLEFPDVFFYREAVTVRKWPRDAPLYVATEDTDPSILPKISAHFSPIRMWRDVELRATRSWRRRLDDGFFRLPQQELLRATVVGVIEQQICACAEDFVPSPLSYFSREIVKMREDFLTRRCDRM